MRLKRNEAQMMDAKNNSFKETQKLHLEEKKMPLKKLKDVPKMQLKKDKRYASMKVQKLWL